MSQPAFLAGKRVRLRALTEADADGPYVSWLNDAEVCAGNSHHVFPYGRDAARDFIRAANQRTDALTLAIELVADGRHVGNIALNQIHPRQRSAEFAVLLGDKSVWGTGVASEAAQLIVAHGFSALGLHRIHCGTFADNAGMIALARKLHMREEGRRVEAAWKDGRFVDVIEFAVLAREWAQ
ncbi:GNAT family N-acetyltransferase [Chitinimonas sp. BJYL2]|uniref:GNAT family N-acetyltransferase n=1 Tax=Chitinimonas sp. BJYL2 TaxID=2976696 RepID=UPI0022B404C6|nr:GNAT family protein [Chitinimonas sp. BJYL2]